jgi:hypothetical protein
VVKALVSALFMEFTSVIYMLFPRFAPEWNQMHAGEATLGNDIDADKNCAKMQSLKRLAPAVRIKQMVAIWRSMGSAPKDRPDLIHSNVWAGYRTSRSHKMELAGSIGASTAA